MSSSLPRLRSLSIQQSHSASPRLQSGVKTPRSDCTLWKRERNYENSPSIRNHSGLYFSSLSPCFEDKPKLHPFSFSNSPGTSPFTPFGAFNQSFTEDANKGDNESYSKDRRASLHAFGSFSPSFPHAGVLWCEDAKQRRKSLDSSVINVPDYLDANNNLTELEKGNEQLVTNSKYLSIDTIIGKGGFGTVKVGFWKGEKVAIKITKGRKAKSATKNEENSFHFGHHMNLVSTKAIVLPCDPLTATIEYLDSRDGSKMSYTTPLKNLNTTFGITDDFEKSGLDLRWSLVITELCTPTNLLALLNSHVTMTDNDKLRILRQIGSALHHIHTAGFAHLDVKPANCFFTPSGIVKLGDFGCTCRVNEIPTHPLGTVAYQAPEALSGSAVTDRCDIYSLGVTTWQVLTRKAPYAGYHPHVIIYKVTRMGHRPTDDKTLSESSFIESALFSVARKCWAQIPEKRPSANAFIRYVTSLFFSSL